MAWGRVSWAGAGLGDVASHPVPGGSLRVEGARDGLGNGVWGQRCGVEVPEKAEGQERLHPVGRGVSPDLALVLGQKPVKDS